MKGSCYPQIFTEAYGPLSSGVCSNSCPLSRWRSLTPCCPLLFAFSLSQHQDFSNESALWIRWPKSVGASASVLPMTIQSWFPLGLTGLISLQSKRLSSLLQPHNSKALILQHSSFFMIQLSHLYVTTGKTISLTIQIFVGKVMS